MTELSGEIVVVVLGVCGAGWAVFVAALTLAAGKVRAGQSGERLPVTVVIAARNEEARLSACLDSLRAQNYPPDLYEVIVADDRSTDGTGAVLDTCRADWHALTVVRIDAVPVDISPKKHALGCAIGSARGDIILQTDADCIVPPGWISGMVARFEPGIDFVAGVAPYNPGDGFVARFVTHEYFWNLLLSAGSIALGMGSHASGRNMGFRRAVFEGLGGYGDGQAVLSGDDTLLMQRFQRHRRGSIATAPLPATHVYTDPPSSFAALARQRIRHMSTGRYFHPAQIGAGMFVYGFHVLMVLAIVLSPLLPFLGAAAALAFAAKTVVDAVAFARVGRVVRLQVPWSFFIAGEFLVTLYLALFPLLGALVPVTWKENR